MAEFRDEQYMGYLIRLDVVKYEEGIAQLEYRIKAMKKAIEKIQNECSHIYYFYCSGADKDHYVCIRCRHTTEH